VLCAFAALRDPAVAYTIDSVKRRLTQRRKDAKKDKKGYSRLAAAGQTVEWSGVAVAAESEGWPRGRQPGKVRPSAGFARRSERNSCHHEPNHVFPCVSGGHGFGARPAAVV
jgi:hypothetical protein